MRIQNIYNPENFDRSLRKAAEFIKEHSDKYKKIKHDNTKTRENTNTNKDKKEIQKKIKTIKNTK